MCQDRSVNQENLPGQRPSRSSALDAHLPDWLVRRPLLWGWLWGISWTALIVADEYIDFAGWAWFILVACAALPSLGSTLAILHVTPRDQVKVPRESVLALFFVRFLALVAAFVVWSVSVVISASISTTVQTLAGDSEREVTALGFKLMAALIPLVVWVLWLAFIGRCAWFLRRLRGWRQFPTASRVPQSFLRGQPRLRKTVVALAHPGLLLLSAMATSLLSLFLGTVELTLIALP